MEVRNLLSYYVGLVCILLYVCVFVHLYALILSILYCPSLAKGTPLQKGGITLFIVCTDHMPDILIIH